MTTPWPRPPRLNEMISRPAAATKFDGSGFAGWMVWIGGCWSSYPEKTSSHRAITNLDTSIPQNPQDKHKQLYQMQGIGKATGL